MGNLTEKGTLAQRPAPSTNPAGYYFATDVQKYFKSSGDTWIEITPDLEDIDPRSNIAIVAARAEDGTIDTLQLDNNGKLKVSASGANLPGFDIPTFNQIAVTYVGSTNNVNTVTYKLGAATVATLTFAYADSSANDALITGITKS